MSKAVAFEANISSTWNRTNPAQTQGTVQYR